MPYRTEPLETYVSDAAAGQPTPGGGSASALAGSLGAAMACMAANFTVDQKKYKDVWPRVNELLDRCRAAREELLELVDEDVAAYANVSQAFGMSTKSDEERKARRAAIQTGLRAAMQPPLKTFRACADVIDTLKELGQLANPNLVSDVGVAAALCLGALEGAQLNVEINLAFLKDEELVNRTRDELAETGKPARAAARKVLDKISKRIRK